MKAANSPLIQPVTSCAHCGDHCPDTTIQLDAQTVFCCHGCKTVYQILHENGLEQFYQLGQQPGGSRAGSKLTDYDYLDDPDLRDRLLDFREGGQAKVRFHLPQVHCSACIWLLENLYRLKPGILEARVYFTKREVSIRYDEKQLSLRDLAELLDSIGYPPNIKLANQKSNAKQHNRRLWYQLGFSGFAFGNIMLLSFPEYLGLEPGPWLRWMHYINLVLAIPVTIYCGSDYLRAAWLGLRQKHLSIDLPIALGILALLSRSIYEILFAGQAGYLDSLVGLLFFLLIGKWFQQKSYDQLAFDRDYTDYFPLAVRRKKGTAWVSTPLEKIEPGDLLLLQHQDIIPTDGELLQGQGRIDYSFVTGESDPVRKQVGDTLYAGGKQVGAAIQLRVHKRVDQSYLTQLWNDVAFAEKDAGAGSRITVAIGKYFTLAILLVATATFLYWLPSSVETAFLAASSVLIVACPCAIALAIPFTYGNLLRLFARQGLFLKNAAVSDLLPTIDHIVFDKTGTLTQRNLREVNWSGDALSDDQKEWVYQLCQQSNHPKSQAIAAALNMSSEVTAVEQFTEVIGSGVEGKVTGHEVRLGKASWVAPQLDASEYQGREVLQIDGVVLGSFGSRHRYREEMSSTLSALRKDYSLSVLSGDHAQERDYLLGMGFDADQLHFEQSPQDKLEHIRDLQQAEEHVLMVGDGLNDAGALQESHLGIVLSEDLSSFTPASDAILRAEQFGQLPRFIRLARYGQWTIYLALFLALLYNLVGLSFAVQGLLSPLIAAILMPLSSVTIVLVCVGASWAAYGWLFGQKED